MLVILNKFYYIFFFTFVLHLKIHEIDLSNLNQNTFNQEEPRTKVKKSRADFLANSITTAIGLIQKDCEVPIHCICLVFFSN